ncbi:MAG: glycosyltransferase family 2 protein, partial [Bacteroidia bacterium]|nr:glycosyltransferase family 2 protein [Bacteroidia bacterium]
FVLLNNDVEVPLTWIEPVIAAMQADESIAAAQPKIMQYQNKSMFEYAGAAGGYMDKLGYVFCRGRVFEILEEDKQQYDDTREVFWASGACFFVKSAAFREVGGFDENFFAHMEEIGLCWRLQLSGYKIIAVGSAYVNHLGGSTLQKADAQKTFLNFRNSLIMLLKNMPAHTLWWFILTRSFLDLLSSLFFLMNAKTDYFMAVHRAHVQFYFHFGKWFKLRKTVKRNIDHSQLKGIYKGSIIYQHFIMGKQYFKDL